MRKRILYILLLFAITAPLCAQITTPTKGRKQNAQQREQIQIDEQLASQYYREQNYEEAMALYKKLYEKTGQPYHFQQYIECCIILKQYKDAERELKKFYNANPNYHKSLVDLVYIYELDGKTDKANKQFNEIYVYIKSGKKPTCGSKRSNPTGVSDEYLLKLQRDLVGGVQP